MPKLILSKLKDRKEFVKILEDQKKEYEMEEEDLPFNKDEILNDLKLLSDKDKDFKYQDGDLVFTTKKVKLKDIQLGKFQIIIPIEMLNRYFYMDEIKIEAVKPNYSKCNDHLFHPHFGPDYYCFGDAQEPLRRLLHSYSFLDFFETFETFLNYVGYETEDFIETWEGYKCENCELNAKGEEIFCESCNLGGCKKCIRKCYRCKNISHIGCGEQLSKFKCSNCIDDISYNKEYKKLW